MPGENAVKREDWPASSMPSATGSGRGVLSARRRPGVRSETERAFGSALGIAPIAGFKGSVANRGGSPVPANPDKPMQLPGCRRTFRRPLATLRNRRVAPDRRRSRNGSQDSNADTGLRRVCRRACRDRAWRWKGRCSRHRNRSGIPWGNHCSKRVSAATFARRSFPLISSTAPGG